MLSQSWEGPLSDVAQGKPLPPKPGREPSVAANMPVRKPDLASPSLIIRVTYILPSTGSIVPSWLPGETGRDCSPRGGWLSKF